MSASAWEPWAANWFTLCEARVRTGGRRRAARFVRIEAAHDGALVHLSAAIGAALDEVTAAAISAVGDLINSRAEGPSPAAVRGIGAVADQLAEQQVAVLLMAADVASDAGTGLSYRIGSRPTEFLVGDSDPGTEVPLEDGLVWAAIHQDAIIVQLPDRAGPLAGESAAALLRRGSVS